MAMFVYKYRRSSGSLLVINKIFDNFIRLGGCCRLTLPSKTGITYRLFGDFTLLYWLLLADAAVIDFEGEHEHTHDFKLP